jgi:uncharacterized protein YrrD
MKFGEIRNKPVVSVAGAGKLGYVDDVLVDTASSRVSGFIVRSGGLLTHYQSMLLSDVRNVGSDAVTVEDASRLNARDKFAQFSNATTGGDLFGSRVMTESGQEIGSLADLDADLTTGRIERWVLAGSLMDRLRKEEHTVPPEAIRSFGQKLVVVSDEVAVS